MRARGSVRAALVLAAAVWVGGAAGAPPGAREILRRVGGFTDTDFAAIDRGHAIAKVLDTGRREIAVAGAVLIKGPRDLLVDRMRVVENLRRSDMVLAVGTFSRVPRPEDLERLPFEEYDLDVRNCRPGDCKVRLPAESIARFRNEVDWSSPEWRTQSAALWRQVLASYAADYHTRGTVALAYYDNKKERLSVEQEYAALLGESAFVAACAPEFYAYLQDAAKVRLDGAEDLMYWSKEDFSIRPVTRITHQTIYRPSERCGHDSVLIATKQIYGTHYLDAALGLTFGLDVPPSISASGFYMVVINRARTRSLGGFLRSPIRSIVQGRSRDALENILKATKASLEAAGSRTQ